MAAYGIAVVEILMVKEEELFILIIEPKIFLNYSTKKILVTKRTVANLPKRNKGNTKSH